MSEVRAVIRLLLDEARDMAGLEATSEQILCIAVRLANEQTLQGLEIFSVGKCPHETLKDLWAELKSSIGSDGMAGAYLSGKDVMRILAVMPSWRPSWLTEPLRPCKACGGSGVEK